MHMDRNTKDSSLKRDKMMSFKLSVELKKIINSVYIFGSICWKTWRNLQIEIRFIEEISPGLTKHRHFANSVTDQV